MLTKNDILQAIYKARLPAGGYWITAGAGLVMHGVKEQTRDIDIGCTLDLFSSLKAQGYSSTNAKDGTRMLSLTDELDVFENWAVDEVTHIEGLPVATLPSIRKQKVALGREKDQADIALIDQVLGKT